MRFLLLFLLLICADLIAQTDYKPGYVITNSMDTIKGFVDYRGEVRNMKVCNFKKSLNDVSQTFLPGDIYGYRYNVGKYYVSKYINTDEFKGVVFVEFLLKGKVNLYYFNNVSYASYFIEDENSEMLEVKHKETQIEKDGQHYVAENKKYIGILNYAFREYPQISQLSKNVDLTHKGMINITKKYHDYVCSDQACILYEKKVPVLKIELRPEVGLDVSSLRNIEKTLGNASFNSSTSAFIGLGANFIIPRFNEKMSVLIATSLNRDYFYGTSFYETAVYKNYYSYHFYNTNLTTDIALKYLYPKGNIRPEVYAGAYFKSNINKSGRQDTEEVNGNIVTINSIDLNMGDVNPFGFIIGVGAEYKLFKKMRSFCEFKYLHGIANLKISDKMQMRSLRFSTGLIL